MKDGVSNPLGRVDFIVWRHSYLRVIHYFGRQGRNITCMDGIIT